MHIVSEIPKWDGRGSNFRHETSGVGHPCRFLRALLARDRQTNSVLDIEVAGDIFIRAIGIEEQGACPRYIKGDK